MCEFSGEVRFLIQALLISWLHKSIPNFLNFTHIKNRKISLNTHGYSEKMSLDTQGRFIRTLTLMTTNVWVHLGFGDQHADPWYLGIAHTPKRHRICSVCNFLQFLKTESLNFPFLIIISDFMIIKMVIFSHDLKTR